MTYTILNQCVFGIRLFERPTDISQLEDFFYKGIPEVGPKETIISLSVDTPLEKCEPIILVEPTTVTHVKTNEHISVGPPIINKKKKPMTMPEDTLFWNVFIAVYGESEFRLIGNKFSNREWEEKNRIRQVFADRPKELQTTNHKITLGNIKEMMSEYMTGKTTIMGIVGLAVYYKIQIVLVDEVKKTHLSFLPENVEHEPCILYKTAVGFRLADSVSIETIRETTFGLEGYTRPLRAISSYKRPELDVIAEKCGMNLYDKSKDEVYKALSEYLVWL